MGGSAIADIADGRPQDWAVLKLQRDVIPPAGYGSPDASIGMSSSSKR